MPIGDAKQLGAALQRERKRQRLTQTRLAEKAGLRQQTISAVEGGKPRSELQIIFDIMTALGLEISLSARQAGFAIGAVREVMAKIIEALPAASQTIRAEMDDAVPKAMVQAILSAATRRAGQLEDYLSAR